MNNLSILAPGQKRTRKKRSPNFPVAGLMKPFGLYPILCHPVLPGETLNNFQLKWRTLSKPVKHPLAGAWLETWLVYVKLTDLNRDLGNMFIDDTYSTTGYLNSGGDARYYTADGQIDWIKLITERIHDAYFMDDSETARTIDGVRQTKLSTMSWYQNCMFKPADDALAVTDIHDTVKELDAYMMMQQMNMTELTYEKYLEQYGVTSIRQSEGDPEILRYARSWTQPVNTVDPSNGAPSSAWVWSDDMKATKDKRFAEPGFVIALASVRPKMYQKHVQNSFVGNLWGFTDWFPAYNLEDPTAGIRTLSSADKVFHADHRTDVGDVDLLYDHRDLLNHGEAFVNDWTGNPFSLPLSTGMVAEDASDNASMRGEYATDTDIAALFTSATATDQFCYYEGIGHMDISGHVTDTTPGGR